MEQETQIAMDDLTDITEGRRIILLGLFALLLFSFLPSAADFSASLSTDMDSLSHAISSFLGMESSSSLSAFPPF